MIKRKGEGRVGEILRIKIRFKNCIQKDKYKWYYLPSEGRRGGKRIADDYSMMMMMIEEQLVIFRIKGNLGIAIKKK